MDGDGTFIALALVRAEVLFCHLEELIYNVIWRRRSIDEKQIVVGYIVVQEVFSVIFLLV